MCKVFILKLGRRLFEVKDQNRNRPYFLINRELPYSRVQCPTINPSKPKTRIKFPFSGKFRIKITICKQVARRVKGKK